MPDTARTFRTQTAGALLRRAAALHGRGEAEAAADVYRRLLARFPGNLAAKAALSGIEAAPPPLPRARDAEEGARIAALVAASREGRHKEVLALGEALARDHPGAAVLHNILGVARSGCGDVAGAVAAFEAALALRPAYAEAAFNMGVALQAADRRAEAIAAYARGIEIAGAHADAWNNIGAILNLAGDFPAALAAFDRAVADDAGCVEARNNRGLARKILGDLPGAIEDFQAALGIDPGHVGIYTNIAHALKTAGMAGAARTCLWQALRLDRMNGAAARELSELVRGEEAGELAGFVDAMLARAEAGSAVQMHAQFAAANLAMRRGDPGAAVALLEAAGRTAGRAAGYDPAAEQRFFGGLKALFEAVPEPLEIAPAAVTPVFVLGMPRSGTSLIETMLARHSAVHGAGELEDLRRAVMAAGALEGPLTREKLARVRAGYLGALAAHVPGGAEMVIDKMPLNFRFIGHILSALPEAKVVHVRRRAEAVCWSNFRLYFPAPGMAFGYDQRHVAAYWRLYDDLMRFWEARYPGRIVTVDYEALTEAPEAGARALTGALGLGWEDAVLSPEASARPVRTASALQVREKIYAGSSDAWEVYAPWLGEMLAGLRGES